MDMKKRSHPGKERGIEMTNYSNGKNASRTRQFDGKSYKSTGGMHLNKAYAEAEADKYRKQGYNARITATEKVYGYGNGPRFRKYAVWVRK